MTIGCELPLKEIWEAWVTFAIWPYTFAKAEGGLASWLQALGSIGAIIGAFFIAQNQGKKQLAIAREQSEAQINALKEQSESQHRNALKVIEEQRRLDLDRRFQICSSLFSSTIVIYKNLLPPRTGNVEKVTISLEKITGLKRTIEYIPPFEYPSGCAYIYFSNLANLLGLLAEALAREAPNSAIVSVHVSQIDHPNSELGKIIRTQFDCIIDEYAEVNADRIDLNKTKTS
ncbi:hypothetical protein ACKF11_08955 [Methylobacillus sp. Pita2]|uniref:hypothetical protein n=1 Tax=Methylobacillus sp. Pita2 TaxID=3383245 RepID=UPI0038B547F1